MNNSSSRDQRVQATRRHFSKQLHSSHQHRVFDEEEFSGNDFSLHDLRIEYFFELETSRFFFLWNNLLAMAAFLDFSVAFIQSFPTVEQSHVFIHLQSTFPTFKLQIELFFSGLWFLDAFIAAHQIRIQTLRARDKARLLAKTISKHNDNEEEEERGGGGKWWNGAEAVYITSVTIQLLLLPTGFYMYVLARLFRPNVYYLYFSSLLQHEQNNTLVVDGEEDPFAHYTLLYALVKHMQYCGASLLYGRVHTSMTKIRFSVIRNLFRRGIARPFRFYQRARRFVRIVQWVHYLGPLVNKVKEFREHIHKLRIQFKQERDARRTKRLRARSWKDRNKEESRDYAARIIQGTFRSHQVRRRTNVLRMLTGEKEYIAARLLQRHFRVWLQHARERMQKKRREFRLLQKEECVRRKQGEELEVSLRLRMYELQRDLNANARRLINEQLLLMPDTSFAVAWKVLFVTVVACDVLKLLVRPVVERYRHVSPEAALASLLNTCLKALRIPPELICQVFQKEDPGTTSLHYSCDSERTGKLFSLIEGATWIPKQKCQNPHVLPWYCKSRLAGALEAAIIHAMQFLHRDVVSVVGIIRFLDIFVTFFTGELDRRTGFLKPKPFFTRWILPGLLLQTMVNPSFDTFAEHISPVIFWMRQQGPFRVLRWTVALFYPTALCLKALVLQQWRNFVKFENNK